MLLARLLQVFGVLLAAIGLLGYWANQSGWGPATTEVKTVLSEGQRAVLGIDADDFHTSFVIAGRECPRFTGI